MLLQIQRRLKTTSEQKIQVYVNNAALDFLKSQRFRL